jgi:anti-sigma regulatory factor (Ser/Thr protein kinase)
MSCPYTAIPPDPSRATAPAAMMERMAARGGPERPGRPVAVPPERIHHAEDVRPNVILELCGNPAVREVLLSSRREHAGTARRLTVAVLRGWNLGSLCETGELLVSELVGNAIRHAGARTYGLRIVKRRGWVRAEVRDPSRALPCLVPIVRDLDESGRGLLLVETLADRWGVELLPRGKTTWFELRTPQ